MTSSVKPELTDRYGNAIPEWYHGYVKAIGNNNFRDLLERNLDNTTELMNSVSPEKENFAYAPGKWTTKEVLLHYIDTERIFACRALCFSRNDKTNLPGFDENSYTPNSGAQHRTMESLKKEYVAVRNSTIELFKNFDENFLCKTGSANNYIFSVELCGIIIVGHEMHHLKILKERYL